MSSGLHNADATHLFHTINDGLTWLVNSIAPFCLSKWLIKPLSFRSKGLRLPTGRIILGRLEVGLRSVV